MITKIEIQQKILSSIFPEKLTFSEKKYRTTKMNEVIASLFNNNKGFRECEKDKSHQLGGLSTDAPRTGLEPVTQ